MPTDQGHSIAELATLAGTTPRTVRYYISVGLLPSPGQVGPGARYGDNHLRRLRLIRRLQSEHQPLAEIRGQLDGLDDDQVEQALTEPTPEPSSGSALDYIRSLKDASSARPLAAPTSPSIPAPMPMPMTWLPASPERSQWERVAVGPHVEIHIRRPLSRRGQKQVERLITIAREMLEEDQP
jgi:DNA-binding transcriptional MerR regulator